MLNLVFFDYPFIHIDRFCITLSSFFIMLFFLLSNGAHWYFWEKKYPKKGLSILWSEAKIIWKPKLFTSPLTEEQLTTLHCFLTVCYEKMHIDPIKYRNILISYANNSSV